MTPPPPFFFPSFFLSPEAGLTWPAQDKPEWSGSDSSSSSPLPPNLEDGVRSPLPLHLSEEQLPFAIGISETNPHGCQYCEKAFPQTSFLHVHERVSPVDVWYFEYIYICMCVCVCLCVCAHTCVHMCMQACVRVCGFVV